MPIPLTVIPNSKPFKSNSALYLPSAWRINFSSTTWVGPSNLLDEGVREDSNSSPLLTRLGPISLVKYSSFEIFRVDILKSIFSSFLYSITKNPSSSVNSGSHTIADPIPTVKFSKSVKFSIPSSAEENSSLLPLTPSPGNVGGISGTVIRVGLISTPSNLFPFLLTTTPVILKELVLFLGGIAFLRSVCII